ncbi:MAG: hypothetical protein NW241_14305 [Bacteroidia bacterium]|nr:hypothetical protein [Bacteroidia bacterium]
MQDTLLRQAMMDLLENPSGQNSFWLTRAMELLAAYRDAGGTQQAAMQLLESLRHIQGEDWENRVLEVLDIACGFCRPELRVW